jgi:hypothetical protein
MAVGAVFNALWRLAHSDLSASSHGGLPLVFWYSIGVELGGGPSSETTNGCQNERPGQARFDADHSAGLGEGHVRQGESTDAGIAVSNGDGLHDSIFL